METQIPSPTQGSSLEMASCWSDIQGTVYLNPFSFKLAAGTCIQGEPVGAAVDTGSVSGHCQVGAMDWRSHWVIVITDSSTVCIHSLLYMQITFQQKLYNQDSQHQSSKHMLPSTHCPFFYFLGGGLCSSDWDHFAGGTFFLTCPLKRTEAVSPAFK